MEYTYVMHVPTPQFVHVPLRTVSVNPELHDRVDTILKSRGSSAEAYLNAQLKSFLNRKAVLGLKDTMNFGQYEGLNVDHVCRTDLAYMNWLINEQKTKRFADEVRDLVGELLEKDEKNVYSVDLNVNLRLRPSSFDRHF